MSEHKWVNSLIALRPFIFKLSTPSGSGTGFQLSYSKNKKLCGIATAYHVIQHAHDWNEPIKITQPATGKYTLLKPDQRAIYTYPDNDLALILFDDKEEMTLSPESPSLVPAGKHVLQGINVGWYGFPYIATVTTDELCFFVGHISCVLGEGKSYLVDGVAINGISGSPAFFREVGTGETKILGVISAYIPNRATGETLPGVSYVAAVEPYQKKISELKSLDEAKEQVQEEKIDNESKNQPTKE